MSKAQKSIDRDYIERELREAILNEPSSLAEYKTKAAMPVFDKYLHLMMQDASLTFSDFNMIKDLAKQNLSNKYARIKISGIDIENDNDKKLLAMVEACIMILNKKQCLSKVVRVDYTDKRDGVGIFKKENK